MSKDGMTFSNGMSKQRTSPVYTFSPMKICLVKMLKYKITTPKHLLLTKIL